jgi:hypothetical protein
MSTLVNRTSLLLPFLTIPLALGKSRRAHLRSSGAGEPTVRRGRAILRAQRHRRRSRDPCRRDIVGAVILAKGFMFNEARSAFYESQTVSGANSHILKSALLQRAEAWVGALFLILGFGCRYGAISTTGYRRSSLAGSTQLHACSLCCFASQGCARRIAVGTHGRCLTRATMGRKPQSIFVSGSRGLSLSR